MRDRSRSVWPPLAGVLLLIDGIGALLLSAVLAFMSLLPPVAAIEGQDPVDQTQIGPALGLLVFGIACIWAARRAIRRVRAGRVVGIVVAGALVAFLASLPFTAPSMAVPEIALLAALLVAQGLIIVGLVRWPPDGGDPFDRTASPSSAERP